MRSTENRNQKSITKKSHIIKCHKFVLITETEHFPDGTRKAVFTGHKVIKQRNPYNYSHSNTPTHAVNTQ